MTVEIPTDLDRELREFARRAVLAPQLWTENGRVELAERMLRHAEAAGVAPKAATAIVTAWLARIGEEIVRLERVTVRPGGKA